MITRRRVLKLLGLAAGAPLAPGAEAAPPSLMLLHTVINGMAYYDGGPDVVERLKEGTPLLLRREPTNPYDRNAIEVYTEAGIKLGYLPRRDNAVLANLADQGMPLTATVTGAEPSMWPYDCVELKVYGTPG